MGNNNKKNFINVYTASTTGGLKVSTTDTRQVISATNNRAQYYAEQALKYRDEARQYRDNAKYYAEQNSDVTFEYIDNVKNSLITLIDTKQPNGNYAYKEDIPTKLGELENDIGYSTKVELQEVVPSQENCEGMFLYTNGKKTSWREINSYAIFDTKLSDHILTYEESKGWALQGTYVYKEAIAGSRYGYPDFYAKCLEEKESATATEVTLGSSTITIYVASNGHQYYDISNKDVVDIFFGTMGTAWFYGVDTENERIFLPRNNFFEQATSDIAEVGKSIQAGLPNITGTITIDNGGGSNGQIGVSSPKGAFSASTDGGSNKWTASDGGDTATTKAYLNFNASKSSSIYGRSTTVQPNAVKKLLYICVGNTTSYEGITEVVNQGMDILAQVNEGMSTKADGQWVATDVTLSTATAITSSTVYLDLSEVLPNDGYNYEVTGYWLTTRDAESGTDSACWIYNNTSKVVRFAVDANNQRATATFLTVIDATRKNLGYAITAYALYSGSLVLTGYRRLGTNI